jgi:CDP-diacylglycerol--glycerol-3-phosphate 3-phosphatidyltransferase
LISSKIGHSLDPVILKTYHLFFKDTVINPNIFSLCGTFLGFIAFLCVACDLLFLGAITLLIAGFFDLMDGALARNTNNVTQFGGFLDSVLDRYTDLLIMLGILIHFLRHGDLFNSIITFVAAIGIAIIPYAKARAEAASLPCNTGLLERPERLILILVGLFFGLLPYVIVVLAVFTHVTVIQRILFVKRFQK